MSTANNPQHSNTVSAKPRRVHSTDCHVEMKHIIGKDNDLSSTRVRFLDAFEEAVGRLHAVSTHESTLIVGMDSAHFALEFSSLKEFEYARNLLSKNTGKQIALLHVGESNAPLRIRFPASPGQELEGDSK